MNCILPVRSNMYIVFWCRGFAAAHVQGL